MDRATTYPLEETTEIDILNTNKFAMIGLGKLALAIIGAGPVLHALPCTPGAGLTVQVGAGQIYLVEQTDATAYSSLGADTHSLVKQGLLLDPVNLSCPAPATAGQAINYLVEVGYQDLDTGPVVLPFYNASNPTVPFIGPGGNAAAVSTVRSAKCVAQIKAGAAAVAGSQVTPAVDAGFVAAYVVTVAAGATSVVTGNIAVVTGAPFLAGLLNSHHHGVAGQAPKIDLTAEVQGVLPLVNLPGFGTAAFDNASSATGVVAAVSGPVTVGHLAGFGDTAGTVVDVGPAGVSGALTRLTSANAGAVIGPGDYLIDTTAAAFAVTITAALAAGMSFHFTDQKGTMGTHNFQVNAPTGFNFLVNGTTFQSLNWDVGGGWEFLISYDGTNLGVE